jgi:hypothetical protein
MADFRDSLGDSGLQTLDLSAAFAPSENPWSSANGFNVFGYAASRLAKLLGFASKLVELKKRGLGGMLLQEIAAMGIDTGTRAANALLSGSASDVAGIQNTYNQIQSLQTGIGEFLAGATPTVQVTGVRIADWSSGLMEIETRITNGVASTVVGAIR